MIFGRYINSDYVEEGYGRRKRKGGSNDLATLYEHMLKYKYHQVKQTPSWVDSILDSHNDIHKIGKGQWNRININECFIDGREDAIDKEGKEFDDIYPKELPLEWGLNNVMNKYFIADFLRKYYNPTYPIDLDYKIRKKLGI